MLSLSYHFIMLLLSRAANTTQHTTSASVDEGAGGEYQPRPLLPLSLLLMTDQSSLLTVVTRTVRVGRCSTERSWAREEAGGEASEVGKVGEVGEVEGDGDGTLVEENNVSRF